MSASSLMRELELERELELRRARTSYFAFLCRVLPNYRPAWYHRLMAETLQAVADGKKKRLLITCPPRHGKTLHATVAYPAYRLGIDPDTRILIATYNNDFAKRINRDIQRLMSTDSYLAVFPASRLNDRNIRTVTEQALRNTDIFEIVGYNGFVKTTSIGGPLTGLGGDLLLIDDFCKNFKEAMSPVVRETWWDWHNTVAMTRLQKGAQVIGCATLWHHDDLFMRLLAQSETNQNATQWERLNLPAIAEDNAPKYDPRAPGDALWPEQFPLPELQRVRIESERTFVSMYQQRPSAETGVLVQKSWWRFYTELPEQFDLVCMSADLNFHRTNDADYTVILVIGRKGPDFYILDMVREQMGWLQQKPALQNLVARYPHYSKIFIERAANGFALIEEARQYLSGVQSVKPEGSKEVRLEAVSGVVSSGNVYLPHPSTGVFWAEKIIDELAQFPAGKNDDIVDAFSMGIREMRPKTYDFSRLRAFGVKREQPPSWR